MAEKNQNTKKKPWGALLVMGLISASMYFLLLSNQTTVTKYFAMGGVYAFLPIGTAFLFSFVHGSFTGNFWTVIGIEASKKKKEVK
jgi:uncharacterized integral membrane protein